MEVREIVTSTDHPVLVTDGRDVTVACNEAAERLLGRPRERIIGQVFHGMVEGEDAKGRRLNGRPLLEMAKSGDPISALELYVRDATDDLARVAVGLIVVRGEEPASDRLVYHLVPRPRRRRTDKVIDRLLGNGKHRAPIAAAVDGPGNAPALTRRERQILRRLAAGDATKLISRSLGVSDNTVRSHLKAVFRKLGVHSRAEAVSKALQQHLI